LLPASKKLTALKKTHWPLKKPHQSLKKPHSLSKLNPNYSKLKMSEGSKSDVSVNILN
jgi:hypothetical protein